MRHKDLAVYHASDLLTKKDFNKYNTILEGIYKEINKLEEEGKHEYMYTGALSVKDSKYITNALEDQGCTVISEFQYHACRNYLKIVW